MKQYRNSFYWCIAISLIFLCIAAIIYDLKNGQGISQSVISLVGVIIATATLYFYYRQKKDYEHERHFQLLEDEVYNAFNAEGLKCPKFREETIPILNVCVMYCKDLSNKEDTTNKDASTNKEEKKTAFSLDKTLSLYDNFYNYIHSHCDYFKDSQINREQVIALYETFVKNLHQRDQLDRTYRVLYKNFTFIVNSDMSEDLKREKIELISCHLSSKQMICYFFNQVHFAGRSHQKNEHLTNMKKYYFFKTMFESQEYIDIQRIIPNHVEEKLYEAIE